MAKKPKAKKSDKGGEKAPGSLIAWVIAPIIGIVALPTLVLLVVGMAPTLVAFFIIDRHPAKFTTRTIGYLNFSGCLPYALDLWRGGGVWDFEGVLEIISNPFALLSMYGAAAVGWMVLFSTPPVVAAYLSVTSEIKEKTFKARQKELVALWGSNVRHGATGIEDEEGEEEAGNEAQTGAPATAPP